MSALRLRCLGKEGAFDGGVSIVGRTEPGSGPGQAGGARARLKEA